MSDITEKPFRLKSKIDRMKQDRDKAKGALGQVMQQIKTDFKCNNLEEVEETIKNIQQTMKNTKEKIVKETTQLENELDEHKE
jgi:gas vesicle protein